MKQVESISIKELTAMAENMYGNIVKAVADVKNGIMVVDADMHADEEQFLLTKGSAQSDLWGFNLHPAKYGTVDFIEFDSMINIRPRQQNLSRDIEDQKLRNKIIDLVNKVVKP